MQLVLVEKVYRYMKVRLILREFSLNSKIAAAPG
jgi:hypothetical protein